MENRSDNMFTEQEKIEFKPFVKKKFDKNLAINDAMISAYLDVCRSPLKGINRIIKGYNSNYTSTKVRNSFIENVFINMVDNLAKNDQDYDDWHKQICCKIINYYKEFGYNNMTYGKAQKWVNMSMKYIMLYTEDYQEGLINYKNYFHVPIDRYIAPSIAGLIGFLPSDDGIRELKNLDEAFNPDKMNYCWSNVNDYDDYMCCQRTIRECLSISPLKWEYNEWYKKRNNK